MVRHRLIRSASAVAVTLLVGSLCSCTQSSDKERPSEGAPAAMTPLQRGEYLVNIMGCHDCHTPGYFYGKSDYKRALSGSELGWQGPWGVSYPRNLTPDPETGLGTWTNTEIERVLRSGVKKDGSPIMPPMPWPDFAHLTPEDMASLIAYLKSIPPVRHRVPDRLPPGSTPKTPVFALPAPPAWDAPTGSSSGSAPSGASGEPSSGSSQSGS